MFTPKRAGAIYCTRKCANYAHRLRQFFRITTEQYRALLSAQGGVCAICGEGGELHLDHCHESGAVRALLCRGCNVALGFLNEDANRARRLADYIEHHNG